MDFWDLAKLLFKRWAISLPLLAIAIAASAAITTVVKPEYVATMYVQLLPPPIPPTTTASSSNPLVYNLGLDGLSQTVVNTLLDTNTLKTLLDTGYTDEITLTSPSASVITIAATAKSSDVAANTDTQVAHLMSDRIAALQSSYGLAKNQFIVASVLDPSPSVEVSHKTTIRAVVVVAAAGLLMMFGLTIAADVLLRRRRPRRKPMPPTNRLDGPAYPEAEGTAVIARPLRRQIPTGRASVDRLEAAETRLGINAKPTEYSSSNADYGSSDYSSSDYGSSDYGSSDYSSSDHSGSADHNGTAVMSTSSDSSLELVGILTTTALMEPISESETYSSSASDDAAETWRSDPVVEDSSATTVFPAVESDGTMVLPRMSEPASPDNSVQEDPGSETS